MMESRRGPVLAVGAIVVRDDALLLVRRDRPPAEGLWSLPGGRVEPGEAVVDAVKREVEEETGLEVEVLGLAGVFEVFGDTHYVILDHLARAPAGAEPAPGDDASEARFVPLGAVESLPLTPRLAETLKAWGVLPA
jgi:ADP-ribose pyrophosphatase YjhB (NUDIX family)